MRKHASETGPLQPGKAADIVAVDFGRQETEPVYNPLSQSVYATGRHQVGDVRVAGQRLLADRQLTTLDLQETVQQARDWGEKIHARHSAWSRLRIDQIRHRFFPHSHSPTR